MARLVIGMQGQSTDLESLRHLMALADSLSIPNNAEVSSNLEYVGISVGEAEVNWSDVINGGSSDVAGD